LNAVADNVGVSVECFVAHRFLLNIKSRLFRLLRSKKKIKFS
jgi:hypothetical protein